MDNRIKLEKYILNEFQAKDSQTFLYQLHENSYFDKEKFSILLNICHSLAKAYGEFGKTDNYNEVLKSLFVIFEHTLFLLFTHFVEHDFFTISNYGKDFKAIDVSEYYSQIREITQKIIL